MSIYDDAVDEGLAESDSEQPAESAPANGGRSDWSRWADLQQPAPGQLQGAAPAVRQSVLSPEERTAQLQQIQDERDASFSGGLRYLGSTAADYAGKASEAVPAGTVPAASVAGSALATVGRGLARGGGVAPSAGSSALARGLWKTGAMLGGAPARFGLRQLGARALGPVGGAIAGAVDIYRAGNELGKLAVARRQEQRGAKTVAELEASGKTGGLLRNKRYAREKGLPVNSASLSQPWGVQEPLPPDRESSAADAVVMAEQTKLPEIPDEMMTPEEKVARMPGAQQPGNPFQSFTNYTANASSAVPAPQSTGGLEAPENSQYELTPTGSRLAQYSGVDLMKLIADPKVPANAVNLFGGEWINRLATEAAKSRIDIGQAAGTAAGMAGASGAGLASLPGQVGMLPEGHLPEPVEPSELGPLNRGAAPAYEGTPAEAGPLQAVGALPEAPVSDAARRNAYLEDVAGRTAGTKSEQKAYKDWLKREGYAGSPVMVRATQLARGGESPMQQGRNAEAARERGAVADVEARKAAAVVDAEQRGLRGRMALARDSEAAAGESQGQKETFTAGQRELDRKYGLDRLDASNKARIEGLVAAKTLQGKQVEATNNLKVASAMAMAKAKDQSAAGRTAFNASVKTFDDHATHMAIMAKQAMTMGNDKKAAEYLADAEAIRESKQRLIDRVTTNGGRVVRAPAKRPGPYRT